MKAEDLFQRSVIASTALFIGYISLPWLLEPRLADETRRALDWSGYGAKLPISESIWWFVCIVRVLLAIGLCLFSREARGVFLGLEIFYGVTTLLGGLSVNTATGAFLLYLMNLCEGAVLVMAYTTPLRDRFTTMRREESSDEPEVSSVEVKSGVSQPPEKGS